MREASVSALAVLGILLILSVASATPQAPDYKVGVKVGDIAIYRLSHELAPWNKSRTLVHGILGPVVTFNLTVYNPDGSVASHTQYTINVATGIGTGFFLIAGNLTTGDLIYPIGTMVINETIQMMVAGALRTVNHANYYGGLLNAYWDQVTGLMTEFRYHPGYWQNYTLLSTTAWAPDTVPSLLNMTTIALIEGVVIIMLVIALIVLASRRRRG